MARNMEILLLDSSLHTGIIDMVNGKVAFTKLVVEAIFAT
jgi:hypothetical protein